MSYVKFVAGFLGGGKTKLALSIIQEYMKAGRPVATNINIYSEKLVSPRNKVSITRIPDKPRVQDLMDLGYSYTGKYNSKKNGLLVLDELGTWFNSRTWNDKGRIEIIDFMLHIRKYGWDVLLLVQDIGMVDKQLKNGTGQLLTQCTNMAQVPVPVLSRIVRLFTGKSWYLPEFHYAKTYLGGSTSGMKLEGFFFKRSDLHVAYETRQVFKTDEFFHGEALVDMRASYCELSSWHLKGRYQPVLWKRIIFSFIRSFILFGDHLTTLFYPSAPPRSVGHLGKIKVINKSILVTVLQNEYKPVIFYTDENVFLFPDNKVSYL